MSDVVCTVKDCAYCGGSGFCTKDYVFIVQGTCRWLINNPNYRQPAYVEPEQEIKKEEITNKQLDKQTE